MTRTLLLADAEATQALGKEIGRSLVAGDIVALSGPLGSGKTTFSQGLARSLGIQSPISSPTFVFINEYRSEIPLLHLDAYRLEGMEWDDLRDTGFEDWLDRTDAVRLIEWPEMVEQWLPKPRFWLRFEIIDQTRKVEISEL
jgi:tRNA threonylcarbamoyladenosine biosynthesis protein TsaE